MLSVYMYLHDTLMVDRVSDISENALMFCLASYNVHFLVIYRPPSNGAAKIMSLLIAYRVIY